MDLVMLKASLELAKMATNRPPPDVKQKKLFNLEEEAAIKSIYSDLQEIVDNVDAHVAKQPKE